MPAHEHTKHPDSPDSPAMSATRAFVRGLERNQAHLYSFVRNLVNDQEEARDIVQETFTDAWRATLRGKAPFTRERADVEVRRWLFHVAYQRAVSVRRHRAVLTWQSIDADNPPELPAHALPVPFEDRLADEDTIHRVLAQLDPSEAACVILKVVQGFTAPEIAQILDISSDAARQRLSRALRQLRAAYFAAEYQELDAQECPKEKIR